MTGNEFLAILKKRVLVADGAMGSMLYEKGIFLNACYDELSLTHGELVKAIHRQYIEAGADLIETNTFGANSLKLAKFGLADRTMQINQAAVEVARAAGNDDTIVAGAIGPVGVEVVGQNEKIVSESFTQQIRALVDSGVDVLIIETFSSLKEMLIAINAAKKVTDTVIIAQMTVGQDGLTAYGSDIKKVISELASCENVTVVGLNCSVGPSDMLYNLKSISQCIDKPISIQPNAGMPRSVDGRNMYMSTPEYMAEYAKRFLESGARIIGGCCGTTPAHIKQMAFAVKAIDKSTVFSTVQVKAVSVERKLAVKPVGLAEKSKLGKKIANGEKVSFVELVPPRGIDLSATLEKVKLCAAKGIDAINIPDGPRASSRLSPAVTAYKVQQAADIEAILHICCRDRNVIGMQSDMLGNAVLGLNNALLITGDPPKLGEYPDATAVFDLDSVALTQVLFNLNHGIDVGGNEFEPVPAVTIGVGANPVASDMDREIERFKAKVEAGAEYAITQPIFDIDMLKKFLDSIEGFKIPIIAGIWPFASYKNAEFMTNEVPGVVVPDVLLERMSKAKTREDGRALGIEIAREMLEDLQDIVAGFAVSAPFGNVETALAVLDKI